MKKVSKHLALLLTLVLLISNMQIAVIANSPNIPITPLDESPVGIQIFEEYLGGGMYRLIFQVRATGSIMQFGIAMSFDNTVISHSEPISTALVHTAAPMSPISSVVSGERTTFHANLLWMPPMSDPQPDPDGDYMTLLYFYFQVNEILSCDPAAGQMRDADTFRIEPAPVAGIPGAMAGININIPTAGSQFAWGASNPAMFQPIQNEDIRISFTGSLTRPVISINSRGILSWYAVEEAISYTIYANNVPIGTVPASGNGSFDLTTIVPEIPFGSEITVRAIGAGSASSIPSPPLPFIINHYIRFSHAGSGVTGATLITEMENGDEVRSPQPNGQGLLEGSHVIFTAIPNAGYRIESITIREYLYVYDAEYSMWVQQGDVSITLNWELDSNDNPTLVAQGDSYKDIDWKIYSYGNATLTVDSLQRTMDVQVVFVALRSVTIYSKSPDGISATGYSGYGDDFVAGDVASIYAGTLTGYRFVRWQSDDITFDDAEEYNVSLTFTMPDHDVTVTAIWEEITHSVIIISESVDGISAIGYYGYGYFTENYIINIYAGELEGHIFRGWESDSDYVIFTTDILNRSAIFTMPNHNVIVTALWEEYHYAITISPTPIIIPSLLYSNPLAPHHTVTVAINNTGNRPTGILNVILDNAYFVMNTITLDSILPGEYATFTVTPVMTAEGEHFARITVYNENVTAQTDIQFSVTLDEYIAITLYPIFYTFAPQEIGYTDVDFIRAWVRNVGTLPTGELELYLVGENDSAFRLNTDTITSTSTITIPSIPVGGDFPFLVRPILGLDEGMYSDIVRVALVPTPQGFDNLPLVAHNTTPSGLRVMPVIRTTTPTALSMDMPELFIDFEVLPSPAPPPCDDCNEYPCICPESPTPCDECGEYPCVCPESPTPCDECGEYPCVCPEPPAPCDECGEYPCVCPEPPASCDECGEYPCVCPESPTPCDECGEYPCVCPEPPTRPTPLPPPLCGCGYPCRCQGACACLTTGICMWDCACIEIEIPPQICACGEYTQCSESCTCYYDDVCIDNCNCEPHPITCACGGYYPCSEGCVCYNDDICIEDYTYIRVQYEWHYSFVIGRGYNLFWPDAGITRAEAMQMFYNLMPNVHTSTSAYFTDVASDAWYANAINTMAAQGIARGYLGEFRPDSLITRAEFAAAVLRFYGLSPHVGAMFSDVISSDWSYAYIGTASYRGWVTGVDSNHFQPEREITRAEAVALVNRMLNRIADMDFINNSGATMIVFYDIIGHCWAFAYIMEAANTHKYVRNDDNTETWLYVLPELN